MAALSSILDLIGNTPMVDLSCLSPNVNVRIFGKLEGQNPGGSVKDRPAKWMIEAAEQRGDLKPGQTILESSSGNTGIALAMISRIKGYIFKVVLPENVSVERRQMLEVWGAEIIWSPGSEGSNGAMRRARQIAEEHPEWYFPYQYGNADNPRAHYESTGPEILADVPDVTHFVAGMGTGGTLMGAGRYLKEHAKAQIWAIEPPVGEMVDGLKNLDEGFVPPVVGDNDGFNLLDRKRVVGARESIEWTRKLAEVGVFAGISSGAIMAGAIKCAAEIESGVIATVICDGGWKYLSTGAWTGSLDEVTERARKVVYF
jgi:[CysO sulfur-carrier protein]-thiocarboxylate-dependent cysteine synthase